MTPTRVAPPTHTPTPWETYYNAKKQTWYILPKPHVLPTLAAVYNYPGATEANAELIVRAVNAHAEMVEALRRIAFEPLGQPDGSYEDILREIEAIAKAAIQKAGAL
jgi:hypothetical protein